MWILRRLPCENQIESILVVRTASKSYMTGTSKTCLKIRQSKHVWRVATSRMRGRNSDRRGGKRSVRSSDFGSQGNIWILYSVRWSHWRKPHKTWTYIHLLRIRVRTKKNILSPHSHLVLYSALNEIYAKILKQNPRARKNLKESKASIIHVQKLRT